MIIVMMCCACVCWQSIWENQYYYLFGFLFFVFIIIIISCSQISIVMTYFQLCGEVRSMPLGALKHSSACPLSHVFAAAYVHGFPLKTGGHSVLKGMATP